jgi:DNA-binding HxlR family transcriptional regulator
LLIPPRSSLGGYDFRHDLFSPRGRQRRPTRQKSSAKKGRPLAPLATGEPPRARGARGQLRYHRFGTATASAPPPLRSLNSRSRSNTHSPTRDASARSARRHRRRGRVRRLLADGPLGFAQLEASIDGISGTVLSDTLENLESDGIVERDVVSEKPFRVDYSLTAAGQDLEPVIRALAEWSERYRDVS